MAYHAGINNYRWSDISVIKLQLNQNRFNMRSVIYSDKRSKYAKYTKQDVQI